MVGRFRLIEPARRACKHFGREGDGAAHGAQWPSAFHRCMAQSSLIAAPGQGLGTPEWLDVHFEACRPEYEAMLRMVGVQSGWRVLDAGCGSGSFLPLLAELVGPNGGLVALDTAPANIAALERRLEVSPLGCSVALEVGSLEGMPFADATFDAVWCANVVQYFPDAAVPSLLGELRRVVRPGGLVAVKDVDMTLFRVEPTPPFLIDHLSEASLGDEEFGAWSQGSLRGRTLRRHLEAAGLRGVWQSTLLIERWAPLIPVEERLWTDWLRFLAQAALQRDIPADEHEVWRPMLDADDPRNPINDPTFYASEGQCVAVGRVPSATT